jgi:hypothetical protein
MNPCFSHAFVFYRKVASNKSKESTGETTPSDLPNQEDMLKKVFDEMKVFFGQIYVWLC